MTYIRGTHQCTGYTTKYPKTIHQVARATALSVVEDDEKSVLYGAYDDLMVDLMGEMFTQTLVSEDGSSVSEKPIRRTFATPDRAFASMARQLGVSIRSVPLPFGSLMRGTEQYDGTRDNRAVINKGLNYNSTKVQMHEYPSPWNLPYTFTIWCRTSNEGDSFLEQCILAGWYQDFIHVKVTLPRRVGEIIVGIEMVGTDKQYDLEPGSDKNRILQRIFNFTVYAWVPRRAIDRPAVLAAQLKKYAVTTSADLDDVQTSDIVDQYSTDDLFDER